jgi:hypothetical protein
LSDDLNMHLHLCRFVHPLRYCCLALGGFLVARPAAAMITSELSLELSSSWMTMSDGRSNLGMFLEINVPLDPPRPSSVHGALLQDEQTTPPEDVPLDPLERDSAENSSDEDAQASAWGGAIPKDSALPEPLQIDRQFVTDLTQAALVAQGCEEAFTRLEHLGTRNRASALLPEVALRAGRERDTMLRLTPTDTDPYRYTMSGASNLLLEGRLSWRLGRLLFSSEDLGIERLKLARSRERQRVVERALAVLFQWLRAESELSSTRRTTLRRSRAARWELTQAELHLDALTGGWFSAHKPTPSASPVSQRSQPSQAEQQPSVSAQSESTQPTQPTSAPSGSRVPSKTQEAKSSPPVLPKVPNKPQP